MIKKEHIALLKENEQIILTLHRHWIILLFHFLYFMVLFATTAVLLAYQNAIISII